MKKLFKVTALLLIAGAMMMTGCKEPEDNDGLSGKWSRSITYKELGNPFSVNGSTITFQKSDTKALEVEENKITWWHPTIADIPFTGVKLNLSCNSKNPGYGLLFIDPTNANHYYRFSLRNGNVLLEENNGSSKKDLIEDKGDGETYYFTDWNTLINKEPEENEAVFYTTQDGSINLLVNNTLITTIDNPSIKSFYIATIGAIAHEDSEANATVTATYKFLKFQTSK